MRGREKERKREGEMFHFACNCITCRGTQNNRPHSMCLCKRSRFRADKCETKSNYKHLQLAQKPGHIFALLLLLLLFLLSQRTTNCPLCIHKLRQRLHGQSIWNTKVHWVAEPATNTLCNISHSASDKVRNGGTSAGQRLLKHTPRQRQIFLTGRRETQEQIMLFSFAFSNQQSPVVSFSFSLLPTRHFSGTQVIRSLVTYELVQGKRQWQGEEKTTLN